MLQLSTLKSFFHGILFFHVPSCLLFVICSNNALISSVQKARFFRVQWWETQFLPALHLRVCPGGRRLRAYLVEVVYCSIFFLFSLHCSITGIQRGEAPEWLLHSEAHIPIGEATQHPLSITASGGLKPNSCAPSPLPSLHALLLSISDAMQKNGLCCYFHPMSLCLLNLF